MGVFTNWSAIGPAIRGVFQTTSTRPGKTTGKYAAEKVTPANTWNSVTYVFVHWGVRLSNTPALMSLTVRLIACTDAAGPNTDSVPCTAGICTLRHPVCRRNVDKSGDDSKLGLLIKFPLVRYTKPEVCPLNQFIHTSIRYSLA